MTSHPSPSIPGGRFRGLVLLILLPFVLVGSEREEAFVYFDATTATDLPTADLESAKVAWVTADRKAARLRCSFDEETPQALLQIERATCPAFEDPDVPAVPEAIFVTCRVSQEVAVLIQVTDAERRTYSCERRIKAEEWSEIKVGMPANMNGWEGRKDGVDFRPRIRSVAIGLKPDGKSKTGVLDLAQVAVLPTAMEIGFSTKALGNLFVTGEAAVGRISASEESKGAAVKVWIEDAYGNQVAEMPKIGLTGNAADFKLPSDFGYYNVTGKVLGYRPGRLGSYGVIPDNRVAGLEPNSPYGVCAHYGDYWYKPIAAELVKHVGIAWIRDGVHFGVNEVGASYENAKAQGVNILHITGWTPKDENAVKKPDGSYDFSPFTNWRGPHAKKVGDLVDNYDMTNEPVFGWSRVFGTPRWLEVFFQYFAPQYKEALEKNDPGSHMFYEGYPEQMEQLVASGAAKSVDAFSPHPYAHKAEPEDHRFVNGGLAEVVEAGRKAGKQFPVWIGEMGFTSFIGDSQHFKSVTELEQAALLVRALSINFANGVEKIFYYDFVEWTMASWKGDTANDAFNCEFHFGIVRKDYTPKPAVVAYANLIAQTKGCEWIGRAKPQGNVHIYGFAQPGGKPSYVAWVRQGTAEIPLPGGTEVCDIFGKYDVWGGGAFTLTTTPVYLSGLSMSCDPIPTYKQIGRFYDATDVKIAAGYGGKRTRSQNARPARTGGGPATALSGEGLVPKRAMSSEEAMALWDGRTIERLKALIKERKFPTFVMHRMEFAVQGIDEQLILQVSAKGTAMTLPYSTLKKEAKCDLGVSMAKLGKTELDHALAAYWLLVLGRQVDAQTQLMEVNAALTAEVRAAFASAETPAEEQPAPAQ